MINILISLKKAVIYLVVLLLALFPISMIESSVRTYAADQGREEIVATEPGESLPDGEVQTGEPVPAAPASPESETPAEPEETDDFFSGMDQLEIPEIREARVLAQNNLMAKREEMDREWEELKAREREEAAEREREAEEREREEARERKARESSSAPVYGTSGADLGRFKLTAYCPCYECSVGWGHMTSSGKTARENHTIATDPRVIPEGTRVVINGKVYVAEDTGGGVKGNHIDIFFEDHDTTDVFGVQYAEVYLAE